MIETLITAIVYLIVLGLIWWAITSIIAVIPIQEPIKTVISVLLILAVCLIVIFYVLLPLVHQMPLRLPR